MIIQAFFQNSGVLVRPVSGSSTRVSWFPMAATHCSTEDTSPSEQCSDTPDSAHTLHCRWCIRDKDNETEVFVLLSHPAGCESAARQHSCWLPVCPKATLSIFFSFTCSVSPSASGSSCSRSVFSMLLVESLFWGRGLSLYICSSSNWSMKIRASNSLFYFALAFHLQKWTACKMERRFYSSPSTSTFLTSFIGSVAEDTGQKGGNYTGTHKATLMDCCIITVWETRALPS